METPVGARSLGETAQPQGAGVPHQAPNGHHSPGDRAPTKTPHPVGAQSLGEKRQHPSPPGYGHDRQWRARIELGFARRNGRTSLPRLCHKGPLRVQRPFYPEATAADPGSCHVYLLHPPGGLVSGDRLQIEVDLDPATQALITTPSAGKIYSGDSCGVSQYQGVGLRLGAGSQLEWLPQETILYDGALGHSDTRVDLARDSRFIGWELICLGRPASAIRFERGHFLQRMAIHRDGEPLLLEKQSLRAGTPLASQPWGLQGFAVVGSLYGVGFAEEPVALIGELREILARHQNNELRVGVTWRLGVLVVRLLGADTEQARHCFTALWQRLRPALLDRPAVTPRIWLT